ncbi:MAG TPA: tRNA (adenosine(37)-N6)-threonylcarbamoyltransferase complex dimerization subunit type 1 TsaB [Kiritimatiellia bacterium]|jgi:tRNA threonylcarbamoyl adenosine modification protein YeaZ|nr:tRNA (adenosine(37)-N6)-threonylcarbamoyltransferase complex dimerization subunit type 1 TsaB [Kiritimatiellia bacterium]HOR97559.1 tRNA (adenosine(37)-N6)-threonylcarbamoyltransferase complex dimerization subunit type 1 TsaB [Kiritimatiellia bacterium]HPC48603.1 tRNA (adenosine(37)-N6)-threonylcarbamoyltransferase complex dimerization subunit type 1 TsaB [Kiritimatiellia bacterium]HPK36877.1 tRNA (adenosine(37)-N6)-threonylcarbamoyltransferase complex dimerization subunit type 1 TsaB [Kiriti
MRILVIDRSTSRAGMALMDAGRAICSRVWEDDAARSPGWIAEAVRELAACGVGLQEVGRFVCGLGPGSFSGIRSSLAALQGMALPTGAPVCGVASAAALALAYGMDVPRVTVVGDARRERLWIVTYRVEPHTGRVMLADGTRPTHTAADFTLVPASELASAIPGDAFVVSSDWARLAPRLTAACPSPRLLRETVCPDAADLGRLACADLDACVTEPLPIYLHPAVVVR